MPLLGEKPGDGEADAAGGSGDEGYALVLLRHVFSPVGVR